ncbi:hypothetical protein Zmor_019658 [Zophobas morio]|uniref:Prostaglandin reductase 1 n=1 Tax=Zophobas morio TaxID=2755281 RepID=A0AA38I658_9CUCU|nr:hypothetical protein Zmor_019649 [Zophobas morio]KAJ3647798.1 hypothetical protein Zmor_019658 [Zophobas morio]
MTTARKYVYARKFEGFPKEGDLQLVEEKLPQLKDGEFLSKAVYLSVDPYMRAYAPSLKLGTTFIGGQVAVVTESKNITHPVGQYIVGNFGWRTHTISDNESELYVLPDFDKLPLSLGVGVLGMPGNTAYFGFLEICQPKPGETVVVTGAAGAVGSHVGQIAKIKGCTVIGIAGSDEKGKWLVDDLGFDHFINYKDDKFKEKLEQATPKGVDCYFDNVGGEISSIVISRMNLYGRVSVCGSISGYNDTEPAKATTIQRFLVGKQLKMEGFIVRRWTERWGEGILQNKQWIQEGKLKYSETVTEGFENMFQAFVDMLKGGNIGKAVVKV